MIQHEKNKLIAAYKKVIKAQLTLDFSFDYQREQYLCALEKADQEFRDMVSVL